MSKYVRTDQYGIVMFQSTHVDEMMYKKKRHNILFVNEVPLYTMGITGEDKSEDLSNKYMERVDNWLRDGKKPILDLRYLGLSPIDTKLLTKPGHIHPC